MVSPTSEMVSAGMKRLCADFSGRIAPLGFTKSGSGLWSRKKGPILESIHLQRKGSTYGAPSNTSVSVRVLLGVKALDDHSASANRVIYSDAFRKADGYAYHLRFNAQTWSTYDRCLDELSQFVTDVAEPWFQGPEPKGV